ncbi:MAG: EamA family transporter [Candidatus Firestonebacteria bacterium]|nr:EamA family transporter [Candidatus Firestonebacteria bacterium]
MEWLFISITILGITAVAFIAKLASQRNITALDLTATLFTTSTLLCLGMLFLKPLPVVTGRAILIAFIPGACGGAAVLLFNYAIRLGHFGFSNTIYRTSFIIPIIFSIFLLDEPVSAFTLTGIILTLAAIYFISYSNEAFSNTKSGALSWFIIILCSFLLSGGPRIGQKLVAYYGENAVLYLFLSYLAGTLVLLPAYFRADAYSFKSLPYGLVAAAGSIAGVFCTISALKLLPSSVVFTVTLSGPIILGLLLSLLFFKEKIRSLGWFGIILGIAGIILVYIKM